MWFDEFALTAGDSLRRTIDVGLRDSLFGVVTLSPEFFRKDWTQAELNGLVARERAHGHKVILPIWHRVTRDDVLASSPTLADKVALNSSVMTLVQMADAISAVVRPDQPPHPVRVAAHKLRNVIETHSDEVRKVLACHGGTAVAVFGSVARGDAEGRAVEIAGEAATKVSAATRAQHPDVEWSGLTGTRTIYAHEYHRIDRDLLWISADRDLCRAPGARPFG